MQILNKYINQLFCLLLYLGWFFLSISLFFKHTKTIQWLAFIFLFLYTLYLFKSNWKAIYNSYRNLLILIILFLLFLFWFVLISPYKIASLEAFLLNYFFHIALFFLFIILVFNKKDELFLGLPFWHTLGLTFLFSFLYYFAYVYIKCNYSIICLISSFFPYTQESLLKGIVILTPILIFLFLISLGLSLIIKEKIRYFYILISFLIFLFLLLLGRRAVLLSLFASFLFLFFFSKNKIFKKAGGILLGIFLLVMGVIFTHPLGRDLFIKSRDNLALLLSFDYEKWAKAGSMGYRLYIWPIYFKKSLEEPFSGTGIGRRVQKRVLAETNKRALSLEHSHILFLNLALQAGWHTSLLFLYFYIWTLMTGYRIWRKSREFPLITALFLFLISFFLMSFFEGLEEDTRFTPFWITAAMIWGYAKRIEEEYEEKGSLSS